MLLRIQTILKKNSRAVAIILILLCLLLLSGSFTLSNDVMDKGNKKSSDTASSSTQNTVSAPDIVPVSAVILDKSSLTLNIGATATLTPTIAPYTATDNALKWTSTDSNKASISNGTVTALAAGTCTITAASANGVAASCSVTIAAPPPPKPVPAPAATAPAAPANKGFSGASFSNCSQVLLVTASSMNTIYANLKTYQKSGGTWNQIMNVDSRIGTYGLVYDNVRIEGDLRTPVGVYSLPYAFGTASNPGTKLPYKSIDTNTYFDGQYGSPTYDNFVEGQPNNNEWEAMNIGPYKYGLLINFNSEQKVGKGNAIFLHLPTSSGATAGCVSIDENSMLQVLKWLDPAQNPRIVICPTSDLGNYYN